MPLLGARLCEVAYTNPQFFNGGVHGPLSLSYASDSDAARIWQRGPKRRSGRGGFPCDCRGQFWQFVYENGSFLHIKWGIIRGYRLCEVAYPFPTFPSPPFFLLLVQSTGGGGHGYFYPLALPVTAVQTGFVNGGGGGARVWKGEIFDNFVCENGIFLHIKCHYNY